MTLSEVKKIDEYMIKELKINDEALKAHLKTLGIYKGQSLKLINKISNQYLIEVRDTRYCIDKYLSKAIVV